MLSSTRISVLYCHRGEKTTIRYFEMTTQRGAFKAFMESLTNDLENGRLNFFTVSDG